MVPLQRKIDLVIYVLKSDESIYSTRGYDQMLNLNHHRANDSKLFKKKSGFMCSFEDKNWQTIHFILLFHNNCTGTVPVP